MNVFCTILIVSVCINCRIDCFVMFQKVNETLKRYIDAIIIIAPRFSYRIHFQNNETPFMRKYIFKVDFTTFKIALFTETYTVKNGRGVTYK